MSKAEKLVFPGRLAEQAHVLRQVLSASEQAMTTEQLAAHFDGAKRERLEELLEPQTSSSKPSEK